MENNFKTRKTISYIRRGNLCTFGDIETQMREKLVLECPNAAATLQYSIYYICRICKNLTASTVHNLLGKNLKEKRGKLLPVGEKVSTKYSQKYL